MNDPYYRRDWEERLSSIVYKGQCMNTIDNELRNDIRSIYLQCAMKLREIENTRGNNISKNDVIEFIHSILYIVDNVNYDYDIFIRDIKSSR